MHSSCVTDFAHFSQYAVIDHFAVMISARENPFEKREFRESVSPSDRATPWAHTSSLKQYKAVEKRETRITYIRRFYSCRKHPPDARGSCTGCAKCESRTGEYSAEIFARDRERYRPAHSREMRCAARSREHQ